LEKLQEECRLVGSHLGYQSALVVAAVAEKRVAAKAANLNKQLLAKQMHVGAMTGCSTVIQGPASLRHEEC
jgi:hypothetical protein